MSGPGGTTSGAGLAPSRSEVERALADHRVPGCSVAVLDGGAITLAEGYGLSRLATREPLTPATRLAACSMSKPVAVLAALRLAEQGRLSLDDDVSSHLTRWAVPANGDWRPRPTLRQLASHTAGLTVHTGFPGYRRGDAIPSLLEVLQGSHPANAPGARVDLAPGLQFRYSGAGTTIIQLILEEVTGVSAPDLLAELVLEPLGMADSTFVQELDDPARADGHLPGPAPVPGGWHVQPEVCAAGLWTTPADYLRLLAGVQRAYAGEPGAILRPETAREMLSPVAALPGGRDLTGMTHIGLGFFVATQEGRPLWFGHTGANTGFVCAAVADLTGGRGAVVMTNGDDGVPVVGTLLQSVVRRRGWSDLVVDAQPGSVPGPDLGDRAGTYRTETGVRVTLVEAGSQVELTVGDQQPLLLRRDRSGALSTETLDLRVLLEADGYVVVEQGGHRTTLQRDA